MNFVIYSLNTSEYPVFTLVTADNVSEAKRTFKKFNPDNEIRKVYVAVEDMKSWLIGNL